MIANKNTIIIVLQYAIMTIYALILYFTISPPMQHNNTDPHYVHNIYEKYRHWVISLISGNDILTDLLLTSILISCPYFWNPASDFNIPSSILESQMSPHVMYSSAGLPTLSYLSLSSGIVSHICLFIIYTECTTIYNAHLWVPL